MSVILPAETHDRSFQSQMLAIFTILLLGSEIALLVATVVAFIKDGEMPTS